MESGSKRAQTIDEYIAGFPDEVQEVLQQVRTAIQGAAPEAEETISYAIPTFKLNGRYLIYFAAYKKHIGLYPVPVGDPKFGRELNAYRAGKGTLRFPLDEPMPLDLIRKIVKFRVEENLGRPAAKAKKK